MQGEDIKDSFYVLNESPNCTRLSSKPVSSIFCNGNATLVDEIEPENISDEVLVPESPSPLLLHNNKRQHHVHGGNKLKRTCLEKAFSTMTTSTKGEKSHADIHNQENRCPTYNSVFSDKTNFKPISDIFKNDLKREVNQKILTMPNKATGTSTLKFLKNGTSKEDISTVDHSLSKNSGMLLRKRSTVVICSDSDSSDNDAISMNDKKIKSILNKQIKNQNIQNCDTTVPNTCSSENSGINNNFTSDRLHETCDLKTRNFSNNSCTLKDDIVDKNKLVYLNGAELSDNAVQCQDILKLPCTNSKIVKNDVKSVMQKRTLIPSFGGLALDGASSSSSSKNVRKQSGIRTECSSSYRNGDVHYEPAMCAASTSYKNDREKSRKKYAHKGKIVKYPVDDSDSDVECCDSPKILNNKRITRTATTKKARKEQKSRIECLSSDSGSDISIVSERSVSVPHQNRTQYWRNTDSPDPVEQVRQMEEDEKLAYRLQAQFDAEVQENMSNFVDTEDEIDYDVNSSFMSGIHVDMSNSSDTSSSSTTQEGTSFLVSINTRPTRRRNNRSMFMFGGCNERPRSLRLQQQSFIDWLPGQAFSILTSRWPDFPEDDYETLLQLTEQIGEESKGLKKQQINSLPTRKFSLCHSPNFISMPSASGTSTQDSQDCTICLCEYQNNDILRSLPCAHEFHAVCIDKWLKSHRTCPICRIEVSLKHQFGRKKKGLK